MGRNRSRILAGVAASALVLGAVACGGGDDEGGNDPTLTNALGIPQATSEDGDAYEPRESSVGDGNSETPPDFDGDLKAAATGAGCTVASFPADKGDPAQPSAREHNPDTAYTRSLPPTSGPHDGAWADWGFYDLAIPYKFQIHNLEHGGVIVHYGSELSKTAVQALGGVWAQRPAYTIFVPDESPDFPAKGVVVTSWQRWIVCKPFEPAKHTDVIQRFITTYRGTGPEEVPSENAGGTARGLPKPIAFDAKTN